MRGDRTRPRRLAERLAEYGSTEPRVAHSKLSISLPNDVVDALRAAATETGLSLSATVAAALRTAIEDAEQAEIDAAIEAQNDENLELATAYLPVAERLWKRLEW
jgi:plasmid stability protein